MDVRRHFLAGLAAMAAGNLGLAAGNYLVGGVVRAAGTGLIGLVLAGLVVAAVRDETLLDPARADLGPRGERLAAFGALAAGLAVLAAGVVLLVVGLSV